MTESEFFKIATDLGYSREEIKELIDFQKETGVPFEDLPLLQRNID